VAALQDGVEKGAARRWSSVPWIARLSAGHGRAAAAGLLLVFALLQYLVGEPVWSPVRNLLFDAYQRLMPRQMSHDKDKVVIIDIDDQSVAVFGRWPWPRTRLARLMEETHRLGVLAVGLDIIMPEADDLSPAKVAGDRRDINNALRGALASLPSNDAVLADTLRRLPAVISRAALSEESAQDAGSRRQEEGRTRCCQGSQEVGSFRPSQVFSLPAEFVLIMHIGWLFLAGWLRSLSGGL
jgi:CHASE2 domain-containing sensor protein